MCASVHSRTHLSHTRSADDVADGFRNCRSAVERVAAIAAAAEQEALKTFAFISNDNSGLISAFLASAIIMEGVAESTDALTSVCHLAQLQQQRLRRYAQDLSAMAARMKDVVSEADSMLSDALCALGAARTNINDAARSASDQQHSPDGFTASAERRAYDHEAISSPLCLKRVVFLF
jgi:hypothetical protein